MAQIYASPTSVRPGDTILFHVSSGTATFRVDFYRQGAAPQLVATQFFQGGSPVALGTQDADWGWPAFPFAVPQNWRTGVYLALCNEDGAPKEAFSIDNPANRFAQALFVVRSLSPGKDACILYKLPLFTYAAYNELADPPGSLYTGAGLKVTLHRPGCGAGADPWDHVYADVYDPDTFRQTFRHWDQKFIQWLEANNYAVDYCTDLDVHQNPGGFLSSYRLVISAGHDEYWSAEMRDNVEVFIGQGGNVAFFSGDVCWWRVHLTDGDTALVCDKSTHDGVPGPYDQWWTGQTRRPENSLTGVSYRNAGGNWNGPRPAPSGYTVQYATHWVYEGVVRQNGGAIQDGDVIGDGDNDMVVGYECDGAALAPPNGNQPLVAMGTDGTPATFLVLGVAGVAGFQDAEAGAASNATMGLYTRNGIVLTAATTDWSRVLTGGNVQVTRITRNVIDRLRCRTVNIYGIGDACSQHPAVEGATIHLRADISKLPNQNGLTYRWTASAGQPGATDQPFFDVILPSPPTAVTVTVTITDGTDCPAFGTLTFTPMATADYLRAAMICRLRNMVATSARYRTPLQGVREGNWLFVDPLWDPIKGYLGPELDLSQVRQLAVAARAILALSERLERGMGD